jgi:hypothetical protein
VRYFPYIVLAWIVLGIAIALALPGLAARIGRSFADEGVTEPAETVLCQYAS